jgi:hypothetical protein
MKGNKTKKYKQGTNTKVKNIFWGKMDILKKYFCN